MIPHVVLAACWSPLAVVLVLAVIFSALFVLWHRGASSSSSSSSWLAPLVSVASLTATLLTAVLVPGKILTPS